MNCWKSINLVKEFGYNRLLIVSFLVGLLAFIVLFVPISITHGTNHVNQSGLLPFALSILFLPTVHSLTHILPLIIMKKRIKVLYKTKSWIIPVFNYYTKYHLTKKASLLVTIAPTLLITIPAIVASWVYADYYVYILLFTAVHIGISFLDILYVSYIIKAPKRAYIENSNNGFDILIKAH